MRLKTKAGLVLLAMALAGTLTACGSSKKETTPEPSPGGTATTADAEAVYKSSCLSCHGSNLEGKVGPNLTKVGSSLSRDDIAGVITNGRGGMPSFKGKLNDSEISALADWLSGKK